MIRALDSDYAVGSHLGHIVWSTSEPRQQHHYPTGWTRQLSLALSQFRDQIGHYGSKIAMTGETLLIRI